MDANFLCPPSHRLNRAENWLRGEHASGVVQCGTCGRRLRYDINFNVKLFGMERRYSERIDGEWRKVKTVDDLVWEFEEGGCCY